MIVERNGVVRLDVYVQPRASKTEIVGQHGGALKIRLAAPPVDGAANEELVRFLAKLCKVASSQVAISSGETSRIKRVDITGITAADLEQIIACAS